MTPTSTPASQFDPFRLSDATLPIEQLLNNPLRLGAGAGGRDRRASQLHLESREVVAELQTQDENGQRLLKIGRGCAERARRRLLYMRGVQASQTSLDDAAADAVLGILASVRAWERIFPSHWSSMRFVRVLWLYGCRAAFRSLNSWSTGGLTGRDDAKPLIESWSGLLNETLLCLAQDQGETDKSARWQVSRWIHRVAFVRFRDEVKRQGMQGNALRESLRAARRRVRVLISIVWGASLSDACVMAGFESSKAFAQSARASRLFDSLREARCECPTVRMELARIGRRRFGLEVAKAVRIMRGLGVIRGAFTDSQRACSIRGRADVARTLVWRRIAAQRGRAVELAQFWSGVLDDEQAANDAAWLRVSRKLSSGQFNDLRQVVGLTDKRGYSRRH